MTREEQIEQQTFVYYETCSDEDIAKSKGFIDGAKWADSTMVEKVVEWLSLNAELYGGFNGGKLNEMVCKLKKDLH